jgi:exodeoxyribonuclease VII large subunit
MAFMRLRDPSVDMSISVMCHKSVIAAVKPLPDNARIVMYAKPSWYTKNGSLSFSAREIGLICGRNTDAEKDVVENAKRRWPSVQFEIREVTVQGAAAVTEVSAALRELEANKDVEVIIITRGGGSFEDLLPFSDEGLVRLAASCETPIVSAIGHEKDSPLLDLVADYRASTPTDAAKRVVPDIAEEIQMISAMRDRARRTLLNRLDLESTRITNFKNRPVMKDPHVLITTRAEIIAGLRDRSNRSFGASLKLAKEELKQIKARVRALSPQSTLDRGYSVVQLADGQIVTDPKKLRAGDELRLRLAKGETKATALGN